MGTRTDVNQNENQGARLLDEVDQALLDAILVNREAMDGPRLGDYVRFPTGELERLCRDGASGLQTSPAWAGSYYLQVCGNVSFSGSLNPSIPHESISLTDEFAPGEFWFFSHGIVGAGRGIRFSIPCRCYATNADYRGFLTAPH